MVSMQCEICGSNGNCVKIRFEGNNVFACQIIPGIGVAQGPPHTHDVSRPHRVQIGCYKTDLVDREFRLI